MCGARVVVRAPARGAPTGAPSIARPDSRPDADPGAASEDPGGARTAEARRLAAVRFPWVESDCVRSDRHRGPRDAASVRVDSARGHADWRRARDRTAALATLAA